MDQPTTQSIDSEESIFSFPRILQGQGLESLLSETRIMKQFIQVPLAKLKKFNKSKQKPLKSTSSLNGQLLNSPHHSLCLQNIVEWRKLVTWYYQSISPKSSQKLESILEDAKYLFDLYRDVNLRGGWKNMTVWNAWTDITKYYGNIHPDRLRDDYEKYLYCVELAANPETQILKGANKESLEDFEPRLYGTITTEKLNGGLNELNWEYWNSLMEKAPVVCSGFCDVVFGLNDRLFHIEDLTNTSPLHQTVVRYYTTDSYIIEKELLKPSVQDFYSTLSQTSQSAFSVTIEINSLPILFKELYTKVPVFLHALNESNLLAYHTKPLLGIVDPALEIIYNTPFYWGNEQLPVSKVLLNHGPGCLYIYSICLDDLNRIDAFLKQDFDTKCDHSNWIPQDCFFLRHKISVLTHGMKPGDMVIST